ncbi:MAG: type II toxin-antitoxin system PemK/MazF family toxin [bacterium]|nr:type II toxin-antitoxin system PemK/MazF family toxin [bacterium]
MNWKNLLTRLGREAIRAVERQIRSAQSAPPEERSAPSSGRSQRPRTERPRQARQRENRQRDHGGEPSPYGPASAREIADSFLPEFDYAPHMDGDADPGEVVWTWVPYEDIPEVGKDRPVLVLAHIEKDLVVVQLTSKDRDLDRADEARHGRYWIDVGSGDWDSRGRPSEARIDRLLRVGQSAIRREGGILPADVFEEVVAAVEAAHHHGL